MKHGMAGTRLYECWQDMKKRCYNPKNKRYPNYGARGISVYYDWLGEYGAENFINWALANGYRDDLTLDRIDVNGDYEPDNCRWVTRTVQQNNRQYNHLLTYNGKTQTVTQWARELNLNASTLFSRIERGLSDEQVLTTPKGCGKKRGKTFNGQTKTLKEWAEYTGISYKILSRRVYDLHWDIERALTTKVRERT